MLLLFELSGEHATMPVSELRGIMEAEKIESNEIYHNSRMAIFEAEEKVERIAKRVAMTHSINEVIAAGSKKEIEDAIKDIGMEGSFKIEVLNFDKKIDSKKLKNEMGEKILKATGCKVNVKNPDNLIKIYSYKKLYLIRELFKIDRYQFEKRKKKPFELPITLHPRLARAMVNIARIKKSSIVVDPFCGTGTILIEAGLIGASVLGIEAKKWIAHGCKNNMKHFGIDARIYNKDMRNVDLKADAIVTDFPYGRSSYVGEEIKKLYREAFKKFDEWLSHGHIMAGIANRQLICTGKEFFDLIEIHPYRVHKSLTRFFCLFKK